MSSVQDEVLSLGDSEKSFSGFSSMSSEDDVPGKKTKRGKSKKLRSVVKKTYEKTPKEKGKQNEKSKPRGHEVIQKSKEKDIPSPVLDVSKLSAKELEDLREALGFHNPAQGQFASEADFDAVFNQSSLPNIRVEIDRDDISDGEIENNANFSQSAGFQSGFNSALFDETQNEDVNEENMWMLPQLKVPQKGDPVSKSLASMINVACTSPCDLDSLLKKHCIPENCDKAGPPLVNNEIWKVMDRRTQSLDRGIVETQNLVAAGMTPIIKLASVLKQQIASNNEAKTLISDALTLMGQVQYNLSIRRRYMIRPSLKKKYHSLCNVSMPITDKLFGDDVSKDIKACDSMSSIGKDQTFRTPLVMRGRGNYRIPRRGYSYQQGQGFNPGYNRYQPYPVRGQGRFQGRNSAFRQAPRRTATATSTAPNE